MKNSKIEKEIEFCRDERNNIWHFFLLSIGGSSALMIKMKTIPEFVFVLTGYLISFLLFYFYLKKKDQFEYYLKKQEKEKS